MVASNSSNIVRSIGNSPTLLTKNLTQVYAVFIICKAQVQVQLEESRRDVLECGVYMQHCVTAG